MGVDGADGFVLHVCLSLSVGLCTLAFWEIRARHGKSGIQSLLQQQFRWLAAADLCFSAYWLVSDIVYMENLLHRSVFSCSAFLYGRRFCEFLSTTLEIHIALGFAADMNEWERVTSFLRRSLPYCSIFAIVLVLISSPQLAAQIQPTGKSCVQGHENQFDWSYIMICCGVAALLCYIAAAFGKKRGPAFARALSFAMAFFLTFGPRTIWHFSPVEGWMDAWTLNLIGLNGTINVLTYMIWCLIDGRRNGGSLSINSPSDDFKGFADVVSFASADGGSRVLSF